MIRPRPKPKKDNIIGLSEFSPAHNDRLYLYTKGGQFSLNGLPYIGEYHYTVDQPKTGPTPTPESQLLRRLYANVDDYVYDYLHNFNVEILAYVDPKPVLYKPTEQAYKAGFDTRYFIEKVNDENSYAIEIDKIQYDRISLEGGIDGGLYLSATVRWRLTGRRQDIEDHNRLQLHLASSSCPSIDYAVKNYLEFARITLV